jgi:hypothetical protein
MTASNNHVKYAINLLEIITLILREQVNYFIFLFLHFNLLTCINYNYDCSRVKNWQMCQKTNLTWPQKDLSWKKKEILSNFLI